MRRILLLTCLTTLTACSGKTSSSGGDSCGSNAACIAGEICIDEQCREICRSDTDCDQGICSNDVCGEGQRTNAPLINSVDGDGSPDGTSGHGPHHLFRRVTISGENFDGAGVTLTDGNNSWDLELCSASATELVVELPDGLLAGNYSLTVASQGGMCSATLPVLQGEAGPAGQDGPPGAPGVPCAGCVDNATISANAVSSDKLVDGSVNAAKLGADAVDSSKVLDDSLTSADILDGTLTTADLSDMGCGPRQVLRRTATGWECAGGERCYSVSLNNRNGNVWKYGRFNLPLGCQPPFMDTGYPNTTPTSFGCRFEIWVEHHSGNVDGIWKGQRTADIAIWPDADNSGSAYVQIWDAGSAWVRNIQTGPGENLFSPHWHDTCRWTDSYYNGGSWAQTTPRAGGGWDNMGISVAAWTRCTLRFCELNNDAGTYEIAERTSGPLDDE